MSSLEFLRARDASMTAYLRLERLVPGAEVEWLDALCHLRFGRPKGGVHHELIAGDLLPAGVRAIVRDRPDLTSAYLSAFSPLDDDLRDAWEATGFVHLFRNVLMALDLAPSSDVPDPVARRIHDADEFARLARLRADDVLRVEFASDPLVGCWLLEIDDQPVASLLLIAGDGPIAVIEHVQTLPAHRRQGHAARLLRAVHAIAARSGATQAVLSANTPGRPLYELLGYQPLGFEDVFAIPMTGNVGANR